MPQNPKVAVIPVAGLGTRSLPFSKCVPKELLPVINIPTIQFIVQECVDAGFERIVLITSREKGAIEDHFDLNPGLDGWLRSRGKNELAENMSRLSRLCEIVSIRQKEPLGLGHAILCASPAIRNDAFAVCLGDEIFPPWSDQESPLKTLQRAHASTGCSAVGVVEILPTESKNYGIVDLGGAKLEDAPMRIRATVEKPSSDAAPSRWAIIGRYVFTADVMEILRTIRPGVGGEIQLTDAMDVLAKRNALVACLVQGPRYDMGNPLYFVRAQIDAALRNPELATPLRDYLGGLLQ